MLNTTRSHGGDADGWLNKSKAGIVTVNNMVPMIAAHLSNAAMTKASRQQQDHTRLCMIVIRKNLENFKLK